MSSSKSFLYPGASVARPLPTLDEYMGNLGLSGVPISSGLYDKLVREGKVRPPDPLTSPEGTFQEIKRGEYTTLKSTPRKRQE